MRRYVLMFLVFFTWIWVLSQDGTKMPSVLQQKLDRAWQAYHEAQRLSGQENFDESREEKLNQYALDQFKSVLPDLRHQPQIPDSLQFAVLFAIGELEHYFGNYDAALNHYHELVNTFNNSKLPGSILFKPLLYAGLIHYQRGNIDSASYVFLRADEIQQNYKDPLPESQRLYNTLGVLSYDAGNYRQALNYFRKALEITDREDPYFIDLESNYLINIAQAEMKLGEYDNALISYRQLVNLNKNLNEIYHNMAMALLAKGNPLGAIQMLQKVKFGPDKKHKLQNSFARAYLQLGDTASCRAALNEAVSATIHVYANPIDLGHTYKILGDLEYLEGSAEKALDNYTVSMRYFYPDFNPVNRQQLPVSYSGIFAYIDLYETMVAKAKAWQALSTSTHALDQALNTYISAYALLDHVMATYESDEARMFINKSRYSSHDEPISIAYQLYLSTSDSSYLHKIYQLDQQNKASVLAFNVIRSEALRADSTEQQAIGIRKQITRLLNTAYMQSDSLLSATSNARIRDLELQLASLRNRDKGLGQSWQKVPEITSLQREVLDHQTTLISYHLSQKEITTTIITSERLKINRKKLPLHFRENLKVYIQSIKDPGKKTRLDLGYSLYQLLLEEVALQQPSRLIIIPDNELNNLPFETLTDQQGIYSLEKFSILYQYSTAFLHPVTHKQRSDNMIAFAPFAGSAVDSFAILPASADEISKNRGAAYFDTAATKTVFMQQAEYAGFIHLATHAKASNIPGASYLAFRKSNGKAELLYEHEIYAMNLRNTHMVILSACETASGNLLEGEGIMSLSRAFTYAGAEDMITTLWKADDQTTSYLVKKINDLIGEGLTQDEALRKAKLDLLKDPRLNPRIKHPYYWSHLVLIGNFHPNKGNHWPWILLIVLGIGGVAGYLYRHQTTINA